MPRLSFRRWLDYVSIFPTPTAFSLCGLYEDCVKRHLTRSDMARAAESTTETETCQQATQTFPPRFGDRFNVIPRRSPLNKHDPFLTQRSTGEIKGLRFCESMVFGTNPTNTSTETGGVFTAARSLKSSYRQRRRTSHDDDDDGNDDDNDELQKCSASWSKCMIM